MTGIPSRRPRGRMALVAATAASAWVLAAGAPAAAAPLAWAPCGATVECATLTVPLDHSAPTGATLDIPVIRSPAANRARRIGALVVNPGGPGGSGVEFVRDGTSLFSTLNRRFDIVGFDPRGTGGTRPVACLDSPAQALLAASAEAFPGPDARDGYVAGARALADACRANTGDFLGDVSTENVARDMDLLREALGDTRLTYLGFSYGTYLGATYAALFPRRVRALVLDGALDPDEYANRPLETDLQQARGFERAMGRFLEWCRLECEFGDGDPEAALAALLRRADIAPLRGVDARPVRGIEVLNAAVISLYSRQTWPLLAGALQLADLGDGSVIQLLSDAATGRDDQGEYGNGAAAFNAITIADRAYPSGAEPYDALYDAWTAASPLFGRGIFWPASYAPAFWPVPARDRYTGPFTARGAPPILVVGTTFDPATPFEGSVALTARLDRAVLLTMAGDGHTAYGGNSNCIDLRVERYLVSLRVPASGITCPQQATPPAFPVEPAPAAAASRLRAAVARLRMHGQGARLLR